MTSPLSFQNKSPQDVQDEIFRRMSAESKIKMVSNFFELGKKLNPNYPHNHGTRKIINGHSKNFKKA